MGINTNIHHSHYFGKETNGNQEAFSLSGGDEGTSINRTIHCVAAWLEVSEYNKVNKISSEQGQELHYFQFQLQVMLSRYQPVSTWLTAELGEEMPARPVQGTRPTDGPPPAPGALAPGTSSSRGPAGPEQPPTPL